MATISGSFHGADRSPAQALEAAAAPSLLNGFAGGLGAFGVFIGFAFLACALGIEVFYGYRPDAAELKDLMILAAFEATVVSLGLSKVLRGISISREARRQIFA